MFDRMHPSCGKIVSLIGFLHADIISDAVLIDPGKIHSLLQNVVVNGKARYCLHIFSSASGMYYSAVFFSVYFPEYSMYTSSSVRS